MKPPSTITLGVAVLIVVATLAGASSVLGWIARPAKYHARLTVIQASLDEIDRDSGAPITSGHGTSSLCQGAMVQATQNLRDGLRGRAGERGVAIKDLSVTPGLATGALAGLEVSLVLEGSYDGVAGFLSDLQASRPEVFVDAATLTPVANSVQLNMQGRAFCWTSDRR